MENTVWVACHACWGVGGGDAGYCTECGGQGGEVTSSEIEEPRQEDGRR